MWNKLLFLLFLSPSVFADYCQPDQTTCWPTQEEIDAFEAKLSSSENCLPQIPTFTSVEKQGDPIKNEWFADQPEIVTPYLMLNFRTFISARMAYFVVLARTVEDVSESVLFATRHNLSISVMSTGHEFQDRNSGLSPNSLLIRTTCLRRSDFDLNPDNRFGHPDGVVTLGAGMTWGSSKLNMIGVHELAAEKGRVVVSGHAANVGVVGWSLGGGHGQLVPLHGMGVDQMLEVELVGPDGSVIVANGDGTTMTSSDGKEKHTTSSSDLFWALRGGGGSTWGVIVSMTVKVHLPRNNCTKDCYNQRAWIWSNRFEDDDAEMATNLLHSYMSWASKTSKYWSSYGILIPGTSGEYYFLIGEALYVGSPEDEGDYNSFEDTFRDIYPDKRVSEELKTFDTFHEKTLSQSPEPINTVLPMVNLLSVLMNGTVASKYDAAKRFVDNWIPRCYRQGTPCATSFQFHHTCGATYETVHSDTAISSAFREARIHVTTGGIFSIEEPDMSVEDQFKFVHDVLAPEMYQAGEGSYFSESEYTMDDWQTRLWGKENYDRLASIKQVWDPSHVFGCRHCIGDGLEPREVSNETMPPWRRNV